MTDRPCYSDTILDTIETFLEGAPFLEENSVEKLDFLSRAEGENTTVRMLTVNIDGDMYLVVAKRIGG